MFHVYLLCHQHRLSRRVNFYTPTMFGDGASVGQVIFLPHLCSSSGNFLWVHGGPSRKQSKPGITIFPTVPDLKHLVFAFQGLALDNNLSHNVRRCIHTPYDVVAEPAVKALGDPHHKQLFTVAPVWYYFERIILPYNIVHRAQGKHKNKKH